jgi:putative ABC transport system ATP-binding protein
MLRLAGVHKSFTVGLNRLHVLKGIDLDVGDGELVSIMGSSGSGKSTLLHIIGLLDHHDSGDYHLNGKIVRGLSETRAARYRSQLIGFVFQSFNLVPFKTAAENVALPLYYQKVGRRTRNRLAREYLDRVGLLDRADHLPTELSGGEQQRVAIARAMIPKPKMILADEPTGALDSTTSTEVIEILRTINRSDGVTVIIVTHELDIASMTDRVVLLRDGVIQSDSGDGEPMREATVRHA